MCKRIWDQELEGVPQLYRMDAQATDTSEKAGGQPGPKLWLRLSNSADGPSLCHLLSQIPGPEVQPPGARRQA